MWLSSSLTPLVAAVVEGIVVKIHRVGASFVAIMVAALVGAIVEGMVAHVAIVDCCHGDRFCVRKSRYCPGGHMYVHLGSTGNLYVHVHQEESDVRQKSLVGRKVS